MIPKFVLSGSTSQKPIVFSSENDQVPGLDCMKEKAANEI